MGDPGDKGGPLPPGAEPGEVPPCHSICGDRDASVELTETSVARLRRAPAKIRLAGHEQGGFETDPCGL